MSRAVVNALCAELPGAAVSDPWGGGHDAWKIGGKLFACMSVVAPGVSVKTDSVETAAMLIEVGAAVRAPYFHRSWVNLLPSVPEDELRSRIAQSYRIVRSGLTRAMQATLPPYP